MKKVVSITADPLFSVLRVGLATGMIIRLIDFSGEEMRSLKLSFLRLCWIIGDPLHSQSRWNKV
ncbi:hypothetical protein Syun_029851 [Stephania yunnanensis]|uniref:Uncharacterized protein n=1 Tax=Stephania yunnanensis TaxID=152371 RepID=A0AAP0E9P6_9MAGN